MKTKKVKKSPDKKDHSITIVDDKDPKKVLRKYSSFKEMIAEMEAERNARPLWKKITDWIWYRVCYKIWDIISPRLNKNRLIHLGQKITRKGHFSDDELWDLFYNISRYVLPRLKRYKELMDRPFSGYPCEMIEGDVSRDITKEESEKYSNKWRDIVEEMIVSFELIVKDDWGGDIKKYKEQRKIKEKGLSLFAQYFENLWN